MPSYANPDDFREIAPEFDLTNVDDVVLQARLDRASVLADNWTNRTFGTQTFVEEHEWRPSRSLYLFNWPVASVDAAHFVLGAGITATIQPADFIINNTQHYVELSSLALAVSLTPDVLTLGVTQPFISITYTTGSAIPRDLVIAVVIIAASQLINADAIAQGIGGVISMTIGSYTVTFARPRAGQAAEVGGFSNVIPPEAAMLLNGLKFTSIR